MKRILTYIVLISMLLASFNTQVFSISNEDYEYTNNIDGGIVITKYIGSSEIVNIPDNIDGKPVIEIGNGAFMHADISSVTIPNTVRVIGDEAFFNRGLESITIPESVEYIYSSAFYCCYDLEHVTLQKTLKYISADAFKDTPWYDNFFSDYTSVGDYSQGCFIVAKDNKKGLIDLDKNTIIPCEYDVLAPLIEGGYELKKNNETSYLDGSFKKISMDIQTNKAQKYKSLFPVTMVKDYKPLVQAKGTETKSYDSYEYGEAGRKADMIDSNGNLNIVYEPVKGNKLYIARFNKNMILKDTLTITKVLPLFGTAIIDNKGNYYILYGSSVKETEKNKVNIIIAKYNNKGKYLSRADYVAGKMSSYGTMTPFAFANASMSISNGIIAAHFGRVMFMSEDKLNHQSATVVYANIENMKPVSLPILFCSHSLDQQVIATKGGFTFVNKGDGYPRGYVIDVLDGSILNTFESFHFTEREMYQDTCSILGGLVQNTYGYVLAGSSIKEFSYTPVKNSVFQNKNVFFQVIKKNFMYQQNDSDKLLSKGVTRKPTGSQGNIGLNLNGQSYFLPKNVVDYGTLWLTNYKNKETAMNPKVVAVDNDCSVILWEKYIDTKYDSTYYAIVDYAGKVIRAPEKLEDVRLCNDERPLYSNGKIIWSVTKDEPVNKIKIYTLSFSSVKPVLRQIDLAGKTKPAKIAKASPLNIKVNILSDNGNDQMKLYGYKIGGDDYYPLINLAYILRDKSTQFDFIWNKTNKSILIKPDESYIPKIYNDNYTTGKIATSTLSNISVYFGPKSVKVNSYLINNNIYFRLKDIANLLRIKISYNKSKKITILTLQ